MPEQTPRQRSDSKSLESFLDTGAGKIPSMEQSGVEWKGETTVVGECSERSEERASVVRRAWYEEHGVKSERIVSSTVVRRRRWRIRKSLGMVKCRRARNTKCGDAKTSASKIKPDVFPCDHQIHYTSIFPVSLHYTETTTTSTTF